MPGQVKVLPVPVFVPIGVGGFSLRKFCFLEVHEKMKSRDSMLGQLICYAVALLFFIPQLIKITNADITQKEQFLSVLAISAIFIALIA